MMTSSGEIASSEVLSSFIVFSKWIRKTDNTVKQDAFMPSSDPKFGIATSVTRREGLSDEEFWRIGRNVTHARRADVQKLLGSADLLAIKVTMAGLGMVQDPVENNPNHACIIQWPANLEAQKAAALKLAAASRFSPVR